jgi:glycosyltransferase involved in cell wall biosynthesis
MKSPSISVVIPLYNKAPYIERTLRSIVAQTFTDFEILVIDDGSTDGGAELVRSFCDHRIRLITQINSGVSAARNRGIIESISDYIAFLDADDEWKPEFLDTIWLLKNEFPDVSFFATSNEVIYDNGKRVIRDYGFPETSLVNLMEYIDCCVRKGTPVWSSAVVIYKPLLIEVGMFPVGQQRGEDLDTWFRLLSEVPMIYHNKPMAVYWCGLPFSVTTVCNDVYLKDNNLLQTVEDNIKRGFYTGDELIKIYDYIAWYMSGPVDRLIAEGRGAESRRFIKSAFRSKRLRKQYLIKYVKSWLS